MQRSYHIRFVDKIALFVIGAVNNLPYVIVIASAKRIVKNFGKEGMLGIVLWANTFSGIFARFLNTWLTSCNLSYHIRFAINACSMTFGLFGSALSGNFYFCLVCIFFVGFSSNFGEAVLLCYITHRKKQPLLKSWSSGTGMAGILGAGYSFLVEKFNIAYRNSFFYVSPALLLYVVFYIVVCFSPDEDRDTDSMLTVQDKKSDVNPTPLLQEELETVNVEEKVSMCQCSILKPVWWFIFNCCSVYFLEYTIQGAFADCSQTPEMSKKYPFMFPLLNLMYQVGVFISRSSLALFHFPWVGVLTGFQLAFFIVWALQPYFYFLNFPLQLTLMACVGLFGGCSYVNVFDLIMNVPTLSTKQKEMCTSWNAFFISVGIITSTCFTYVAEQTFLAGKVKPK